VILAVDTSSDVGGVALWQDDVLLGETVWVGRSNHSTRLFAALDAVLAAASISLDDVTHLVVASGPGSFSGLRVGVSAMKGIAMARGLPLTGVSTLDVTAWQLSPMSDQILTAINAGRGQVYVAAYEGNGENWSRITDYSIQSIADAAASAGDRLVVGEAADTMVEAANAAGRAIQTAPVGWNVRRPAFLAELGWRYFRAGGADQRERIEPLYLRRSAAEEKRAAGA
jgi:tRNA threonylcarbamoyladenosine biosynthesis protein TsaB